MSWTDDDVATPAWTEADVAPPKERTLLEEAKRQGGLALRAAANAVASPVTLGGNVIGKTVNAVAGKKVFEPSTDVVDAYLTKAGLPEADTGVEKFTQEAARTLFPAAKLERVAADASGRFLPSAIASSGAVAGANAAPENTALDTVYGALGGGVGAGVGVALGKAGGKLLPASTEARNLMERGVTPTLGQGVDRAKPMGAVIGGVEDVASTSPFHYKQVAAQREGVNSQFREAVLKDATANGLVRDPTAPVRDQITALRGQAGQAFDDASKGLAIKENPALTDNMLGLIRKHNLGAKDEREFSRFIADNYTSRFANGEKLPVSVVDDIRQRAWNQADRTDGPLRQAYQDLAAGMDKMRDSIHSTVGRDLGPIKADYRKVKILEDAAKVRNPNRYSEDNLFSGMDYNRIAAKQGLADDLGTLGHDSRILLQSPSAPPRVNRPLTTGNAIEGFAAFNSMGATPLAFLLGGKALNNEGLRRYLLGNPETVKMVTDVLRNSGSNLGRAATTNIKE
jgi:hypothetical protein